MNPLWENRLYRSIGMMTLLSCALILILPFIKGNETSDAASDVYPCQPFTCLGIDVKDDAPAFKKFLRTIKLNKGVLVLGTSETGSFKEINYPALLNDYFKCGMKFSMLAGAGRASYQYFPVFANNRDLVKELNILYFINPTYWRESLNFFHKDYYLRYNDPLKVAQTTDELKRLGLYERFVSPIMKDSPEENHEALLEYYLTNFRQYYVDLFKDSDVENGALDCIVDVPKSIDSSQLMNWKSNVLPDMNISKSFAETHWSKFVQIKDSDFQMDALKSFNKMCLDYEINVTYFLGPYNAIYCEKFSPEWKDGHEAVLNDIRAFLEKTNSSFIDGSDLSYVPGTFNDLQHHSEYGAWLIADKISKYYEKNR